MKKNKYIIPQTDVIRVPTEDFIARSNPYNWMDANEHTFDDEEKNEDDDEYFEESYNEDFSWPE